MDMQLEKKQLVQILICIYAMDEQDIVHLHRIIKKYMRIMAEGMDRKSVEDVLI